MSTDTTSWTNDQLKNAFFAAIAVDSSTERNEVLRRICEGNESLMQRVDRLLQRHGESNSFLESPAFRQDPELWLDPPIVPGDAKTEQIQAILKAIESDPQGECLGRIAQFNLIEVLGAGGSGVVFKALDRKLARTVAIKFLVPRHAGRLPDQYRILQ